MADLAEQEQQTGNDFVVGDLSSKNGLAVSTNATECLQCKKKFEESKATIAALENKIRKIMETKGVLECKIKYVHILMQGHLKDFPVTSETEGLFKNVLRVLGPDELTSEGHNSAQLAQQTLTPDNGDALSSVQAGSSLGVSNAEKQNYSDIPVTRIKRRLVLVGMGNEIAEKKVRRSGKESLSSSTWNVNEELDENSSLTPIQIAVESFSKSLLKNQNLDDDTKAIIEKLCLRLKCDDVALKLAVSYICDDLLVLAEHIKDSIENYFVKIDNAIVRDGRKVPEPVENPCYLNLRVTCEKIKKTPGIGEEALKVMEIISFLAADNIPTQFVWDLYDSMENQESSTTRENIFQLLSYFSVINSRIGKSFSIHPLIQEGIRNTLKDQKKFTEVLGRIQNGAHEMIQENEVTSQEMIHVMSIWDHVKDRVDLIKEDGVFPSSICRRLVELGKYREAMDFSCRAVTTLESTLGKNHLCILKIKYWNGVAQFHLGVYVKALTVLTEVYEKQKELFGEEDEDCLDTANRIGFVHVRLEKYDKALKGFWDALEIRERIFGKEDHGALSLKHNIALVLQSHGKYKEAMKLYEQVLEVQERVRGEIDPSTSLTTKQSIAVVRLSQREYSDALKVFQEVLKVREEVLEVNHPETLTTKEWIAGTYECLKRNEEASELYKEVLEKRLEILGPEHPQTLTTKHNLTIATFNQGDYLEALKMFKEIVEVEERVLEVDHPSTLTTKCCIAETYRWLGRKEEAIELYKEVLEKKEERLGTEHPNTLITRHNLAVSRFDQGEYEEALKLFHEVLEVRERVFGHLGVDHPATTITQTTKEWIADTNKFLGRN